MRVRLSPAIGRDQEPHFRAVRKNAEHVLVLLAGPGADGGHDSDREAHEELLLARCRIFEARQLPVEKGLGHSPEEPAARHPGAMRSARWNANAHVSGIGQEA